MVVRRFVAAAVMLLVSLAPVSSHSATTHAIDVKNVEFEPGGTGAAPGDTITWTWRSGTHTVTAYQGATFDRQLSSGAFSSFSHNFTGGELRYYCKNHAEISDGICYGAMCGRVSDDPPVVLPPEIRYPPEGSTQYTHAFDVGGIVEYGTAKVKVKLGQATLGTAQVTNQSWQQYVDLPNGTHVITAIAIDPDGFESARSAPLTVTVESDVDVKPPLVGITSPRDPVVLNPLTIAGDAIDADTNISSVVITVTDLLGGTFETDWVCSLCGKRKNIHFVAYAWVPTGRYTIRVVATDSSSSLNRTTVSKDVIVLR